MRRACAGWALCLLLLPLTARADDVQELTLPDGRHGVWMTLPAYRDDREEHARLAEVRVQLAAAMERVASSQVAAGALRLALRAESALVVTLRRDLARERARWSGATWTLLGVGLTLVVEAVVVGLVLWAD